jgi:hypothetical protein
VGFENRQESNQTAMATVSYDLSENTTLTYNHLTIHSLNHYLGEYTGQRENVTEIDGRTAFIRRQQVNDNTLFTNQLHVETQFNPNLSLKTSVGYNIVWGNEPDRRTNTFVLEDATGIYEVASGSAGSNHRFFSSLKEDDFVGSAVLNIKLSNEEESRNNIQIGYNGRITNRDFEYQQLAFGSPGARPEVDPDDVEGTAFNQASLDADILEMQTNRGTVNNPDALDPEFYEGERIVHAGFVNFAYDITPKLTTLVGLRIEDVTQEVFWDFGQDEALFPGDPDNTATIDETYILPSLVVRYEINADNILRFTGSKTYTMPQFKEVSPFLYEDIAFRSFGNKDLRPFEWYHADLKLDHYFSRAELVSFGVFYKTGDTPINRTQVNSAGSDLSYVNTGQVDIYGAEAELRKTVWNISPTTYVNLGANISYLYSEQQLEDVAFDELTTAFTNETSALEGASPLIYSGDITYTREEENGWRIQSTLLYSNFADQITSLGTRTRDDFVLQSYPTLNWINRVSPNENWTLSLSLRNILDPEIDEYTDTPLDDQAILKSFHNGMEVSIGVAYKL